MCPGEENCPTFKTAQNPERACKQCPRHVGKTRIEEIEGSHVVLPWTRHMFWLFGLKQAGAVFLFDDLTKDEWDSLLIIESVKNELERKRMEDSRTKAEMRRQASKTSTKPVRRR